MRSYSYLLLPAVLVFGCDDELPPLVEADNAAPIARIDAPLRSGLGQPVRFDGTMSRDLDGPFSALRFEWDFGDRTNTATSAVAFHAYNELGTFEVKLFVADPDGGTATATAAIVITSMPTNQPPNARIEAPTSGAPGQPLAFDARMSTDSDGTIVSYAWDIGGLSFTGPLVSHTFASSGQFEVLLTVTDDGGATGTANHTVTIGQAMQNNPVAVPGSDMSAGLGQPVMFDGTASFDPDGMIVSYGWDFGDGGSAMGAMASHTYNVEASFPVTLTVTDNDGLTGTASIAVTVGSVNFDGTYSMTANPSTGTCSLLPATFVATTVTFTSNGAMLVATQPDGMGGTITMSGTQTGASFGVTGNWTDSQGADHGFNFTGTFSGQRYTGNFQESITLGGLMLCTLNWNVSGDKQQ